MGSSISKPDVSPGAKLDHVSASSSPTATACPVGAERSSNGTLATANPTPTLPTKDVSKCPIKHSRVQATTEQPRNPDASEDTHKDESRCPVKEGKGTAKYINPHKYDVYSRRISECGGNSTSEPIDPANQMPANPSQQPAPGQRRPLSTDRVQSTIPKGGTESTWTYPSPQMFW